VPDNFCAGAQYQNELFPGAGLFPGGITALAGYVPVKGLKPVFIRRHAARQWRRTGNYNFEEPLPQPPQKAAAGVA
jgi:hypothetical protein